LKTSTKAHAAVIVANLMFGVTFSMVKILVPVFMTSYALNVVRILVSLPLFWLLFLLKPAVAKAGSRQWSRAGIDKADIPRFVLCGLSGVAINQILFVKGLSLTSTIHGSLLALGTPIFITAAAAWLLREKFTWNKGAGLVLGIAGAAMLVLGRSGHREGSNIWLGDLLVMANSISYALYFVWVKPLMLKYSPVHVIRWVFVFGGLMILPFGMGDFLATDFSLLTPMAWVAIGFVALGATFIAYLCNMYGIKYLGPAVTGSYIYSQPMFAAIISVIFLQEQFGVFQILAGGMIALGVYLVNLKTELKQLDPDAA
jgi:drug/metabolite transporter (DMT)-like permease